MVTTRRKATAPFQEERPGSAADRDEQADVRDVPGQHKREGSEPATAEPTAKRRRGGSGGGTEQEAPTEQEGGQEAAVEEGGAGAARMRPGCVQQRPPDRQCTAARWCSCLPAKVADSCALLAQGRRSRQHAGSRRKLGAALLRRRRRAAARPVPAPAPPRAQRPPPTLWSRAASPSCTGDMDGLQGLARASSSSSKLPQHHPWRRRHPPLLCPPQAQGGQRRSGEVRRFAQSKASLSSGRSISRPSVLFPSIAGWTMSSASSCCWPLPRAGAGCA